MDCDVNPGSRVLLYIEDNQDNIDFMTCLVEVNEGWVIAVSKTAEDGIEFARTSAVDLILCDINLPGMNGIDAVRHLRAIPSLREDFPIFALSADATKATIATAMEAGFSRYLTKPTRPRDLKAILDSFGASTCRES